MDFGILILANLWRAMSPTVFFIIIILFGVSIMLISKALTWWDSLWGINSYTNNTNTYTRPTPHGPINFPVEKTPLPRQTVAYNDYREPAKEPPRATFFSRTDGVEHTEIGPPEPNYLIYYQRKEWETKQLRLTEEASAKEQKLITIVSKPTEENKKKELGFLGQK